MAGGRGRSPAGGTIVGVDIGATKVLAALVDDRGRLRRESDRKVHRNDGPAGVLRSVTEALDELKGHGERPRAIGVAVAAQVDASRGTVLYAPNLRWAHVPLGASLRRRTGLPVVIENDVRAATWGEWRHGRYERTRNLACLYIGTGVGGGFVVDGRLLRGALGAAGEVGHMTLVAGGRKCSCPHRGCLEAYVGGWALGQRARERAREDPAFRRSLERRTGAAARVTSVDVTALARAGDRGARSLLEETGEWLGAGAVSIVNALNPSRLLLGGGMIEGYPRMVSLVRRAVARGAQPPAASAVTVGRVHLGTMAPVIGAAARARDELFGGPGDGATAEEGGGVRRAAPG